MLKQKNSFHLPFPANKDVFRWGPVPGRFFYLSVFCEVHFKHFRKAYGENWSKTLFLFKDGRMFFICNTPALQAVGEKVFLRYLLPAKNRKKIYKEWQKYVKDLTELERLLNDAKLSSLSDKQLLNIWNNFNRIYIKFWVASSIPELANYGSVNYLERKLAAYIPDEQLRSETLEVLTAPIRYSFYQEEEIALSKTQDISKHQKNYFWLKNSYAGTQILPIKFFERHKKELSPKLENEIKLKLSETKTRKQQARKHFKLPEGIMKASEAISDGVWWQDERKKYIFISLHYLDILAKEIGRRFGYSFSDFNHLWYSEVAEIIKRKNLKKIIQARKRGFGGLYFHSCKMLTPQETLYFWKTYETKHTDKTQTEIRGVIASKGQGKKVVARVRILLDPHKAESFKLGEILLAPMTSPEYIFAMKKAVAVITDTGGLTSHAAIVSRELGVPCIVDTKIATKIFKDGDVVEVDTHSGIVKLTKKA